MMRLSSLIDPIADRLLELRTISPLQWGLRGTGTVATVGALLLALAGPSLSGMHLGIVLVLFVSLIALIAQWFDPDTDLGMLAPLAVILALLGRGDLTLLVAGATGFLLLIGHVAFAIAAVMPVHGTLERSAMRLAGRALAAVLVVALVACALVALLAQIHLGPWMVALAAPVVVALWIAIMPRAR
jgi:hypothetical protein